MLKAQNWDNVRALDEESSSSREARHKARRQMLDEMQWNRNLRHYHRRRLAWTGGVEIVIPVEMERTHENITKATQNQQTYKPSLLQQRSDPSLRFSADGTINLNRGNELDAANNIRGSIRRHSTPSLSSFAERHRQSYGSLSSSSSSLSLLRSCTNPYQLRRRPNIYLQPLDTSGPTTLEHAYETSSSRRSYCSAQFRPPSASTPSLRHNVPLSTSPPHDWQSRSTRRHTRSASSCSQAIELVPQYKPMLSPDNTIRRESEDPNRNVTIYRELIEKGRTPVVPINLSNVVKAAVTGWKASYALLTLATLF